MLGPGGRPARSGSLCRRSNPRRGSRADEAGLRARVFAGCACCLEPRGASGARGTRAHAPSTGWSRSTTTTTLREATVIPTGNFPPRRPTLAEPKIVGSNFRRSFCSRGSSPDTGGIAMCISRGLGLCGRITGLLIILCTPLGKGDPTKAVVDPSTEPPYLHLRYKIFNSNSAFLLKRANQSSLPISISQELHHQPFLVMNTADKLPVINVAYGPFSSQRPLPEDLWPGNIFNSFTEVIQLRWNFRAFIIEREIFSARPRVKVLFYITGWDWDGKVTHEKYPCIGLYVLHAQQKMTTFCRLNVLGVCLAEIRLPSSWFLPKVSPNEDMTMDRTGNNVAALYYTVRTVGGGSFCGESRRAKLSVIHFLNEVSVVDDEDLHWVANVTLSQAALQPVIREVHLDENILIYIPDKTLRPKEIVKIPVKILKNSTIQNFTLRMKVKKGLTLLYVMESVPAEWSITSDVSSGIKHTVASIEARRKMLPSHARGDGPLEIAHLLFEIENMTSAAVTRRILWQVDSNGKNIPLDEKRVVTEMLVTLRDIRAIVPLTKTLELLNSAVLTGAPVTTPLRLLVVDSSGQMMEVKQGALCHAADPTILKVTPGCEMLYIDGTEKQGSRHARVYILYEEFSQSIELTVWFPRLPLLLEISDPELNQIKNWRIPILKAKRQKRGIFDADDGERKVRGCSLQFQHALLKVWTMFQTVSGPHQVIPFLGPDWLVDVTELVRNNITVASKGVVRLRGGTLVIPEDPGKTSIKVVSPLTGATLGEQTVRVSEDKVSISRLHVQLVSGVQLSIQPSTVDKKVLVATTAVELNPHRLKQECALSMWLQYSDGTTVPLNVYNRAEYILSVSSLDERVASVDQAQHSPWPVVIVEGKGQGYYINVEVNIDDACLKQKRKTTLVSNLVYIRHLFGDDDYHVSALDHQENNKSVLEPFTIKSHFPLDNAGIIQSTTATSFSDLNNHTAVSSIPGAIASDTQDKGLRSTLTHLKDSDQRTQAPAPENEDHRHRNHPVGTPKRGMSDLQIGMYTLLGVFCLAIVLFMANCIKLALKPKCKERRQQQEEEVNPSHEWVCLENTRKNTKRDVLIPLGYWQAHHVDRRPGGHQVESLTLESSTPSQQRRAHRLNRRKEGHNVVSQASPSTERKRVTFSTLTVSNESTDTPFHFSL